LHEDRFDWKKEIYICVFRHLSSTILVLRTEEGQLYLAYAGVYPDLPPIKIYELKFCTSHRSLQHPHPFR